jgi:hypothetical protein
MTGKRKGKTQGTGLARNRDARCRADQIIAGNSGGVVTSNGTVQISGVLFPFAGYIFSRIRAALICLLKFNVIIGAYAGNL